MSVKENFLSGRRERDLWTLMVLIYSARLQLKYLVKSLERWTGWMSRVCDKAYSVQFSEGKSCRISLSLYTHEGTFLVEVC